MKLGIIELHDSYDFDSPIALKQLVRCKECRHYYNEDPEQIPTASIMCSHMHPDDFCSYGSRSEKPNKSTTEDCSDVGKE